MPYGGGTLLFPETLGREKLMSHQKHGFHEESLIARSGQLTETIVVPRGTITEGHS